jgi:hypothetical protein
MKRPAQNSHGPDAFLDWSLKLEVSQRSGAESRELFATALHCWKKERQTAPERRFVLANFVVMFSFATSPGGVKGTIWF